MKREAPILSNRIKSLADLLPSILISCVYFLAVTYVLIFKEMVYTVTPDGKLLSKYPGLTPVLVVILTVIMFAALTVYLLLSSFFQDSYLEMYRTKLYLLPRASLTWKAFRSKVFHSREEQPEVLSYEEVAEIRYEGHRKLAVSLKQGGCFVCYARKGFAEKAAQEWEQKTGRRE